MELGGNAPFLVTDVAAPFGGMKESGFGRESGAKG